LRPAISLQLIWWLSLTFASPGTELNSQSGAYVINMESNPAASGPGFNIAPSARIGYVSLNVSDIEKSLDFYERVLGFKKVDRSYDERALLSVDGHQPYLVELLQAKDLAGSTDTPGTRKAGLYHFAVLLPERKFLADMLQNLSDMRGHVRFEGLANHLVSESIYIRDPDDIGIEIYCDRPSSEWEWDGDRVRMATEKLDTADLLRESTALGWKAMPAKTMIGHVHLHVNDLAKAMKFYSCVLGLDFRASYPGA
jgi:catechol 2,3-dioxygenase